MIMYGIKNCDTCRKALKWLANEGIDCRFHDFRKDGLEAETLDRWLSAIDPDVLINRRGTTYRKLDDEHKNELDGEGCAAVLLAQPTLMKRPIFEIGGRYVVGFADEQKSALKQLATA